MAVEKTDAAMIVNRLRMARELEDDCLKQLVDAEPDEDGIYRDAQGDLWVHCTDVWKQLFFDARTLDLSLGRTWESLVDCAPTERMPFRFITPLTEEEENF
ncbi:hypothetical protein [Bifidobacterium pseudocatenulatum]|uniref:hypothetical protein n=1 Tax=Bifidobacterium pseudocatenulatum TaxID=28026 RepID=UPI001F1D6590|nr:hypothetical protein [Bifidobacterium pseudocatenulatum]UIY46294.1 hypothetical protein L0J99_07360 [Bifidobacterium pseudocatenulatum]